MTFSKRVTSVVLKRGILCRKVPPTIPLGSINSLCHNATEVRLFYISGLPLSQVSKPIFFLFQRGCGGGGEGRGGEGGGGGNME